MKRWWWGAVALWVAVVVVGSALAWIAIDRAGQQVSTSEPLLADRTGAASTPRPTAPSGTPTAHPTAPATSPGPSPTVAPSRSPAPAHPRFRTWTGTAGSVTVSCTGSKARMVGASPADGWHAERTESDEVKVRFERNEVEVEVQAHCTASGPVFEVESRTEDEDEGLE